MRLAQAQDLADLELEQLTRVTVVSASRREEKLIEAPASIFVINAEDIRRSGATTLPEVLRLAPNLHVARADNNQYAISARGFNNVLANKMLVLIDGRTVYTPLFSGVFWEAQDVFLEDVEGIEVISGPAATLWGANGVNGVISIRTKAASRTLGTHFAGGIGSRESMVGARTGAAIGEARYRVYGKYWERDNLDLATGAPIRDASKGASGGLRGDWERAGHSASLQGDAYWSDIDQAPSARTLSGSNVVGRWRTEYAPGASLRLQAYYDRTEREHPGTFHEKLDTLDVELQHSSRLWDAHDLVVGGGYRYTRDRVVNTAANAFIPPERNLRWGNVFVQDEIALGARVHVTLGVKAETNVYTGTEWLPNLRLAWQPDGARLAWAAISRAVRAPSRIDRDLYLPGVPPFAIAGNDTFDSEVANVAELGYRAQLSDGLSFSATAFHHRYPNLRSIAFSAAGTPIFANDIEGRMSGLEAWASWRVTRGWRLSGGGVLMNRHLEVVSGRRDLGGIVSLGTDPKRTALLRSGWDMTPRHELDLTLRHVGPLGNGVVPAYTVLDARLGWRLVPDVELSLAVQNAFDRKYSEWGAVPASRALLERNAFMKVTWRTP